MIRFSNELRRRHVIRLGLLYVASAFAVLRVAKFFLDLFASPPCIARLLLAAQVLLFLFDPEVPAAYRNLGLMQAYALGRIDQAVPWFERA